MMKSFSLRGWTCSLMTVATGAKVARLHIGATAPKRPRDLFVKGISDHTAVEVIVGQRQLKSPSTQPILGEIFQHPMFEVYIQTFYGQIKTLFFDEWPFLYVVIYFVKIV